MRYSVSRRLLVALAFLSLLFGFPVGARADVLYHVVVDTSSISGTVGGIAFQFNPGVSPPDPGLQDALATIQNYAMPAGLTVFSPPNVGGASGDATLNTLTIANSSLNNESDYNVTFGTSLSFDITLSGPAVNNPDPAATFGTRFSLDLFDNSGPLLTTDPNGSVLDIDIAPGTGAVTVTTFPVGQGQPPAASATLVTTASTGVPEPSTLLLLGVSLVALGYGRYRGRRRPNQLGRE